MNRFKLLAILALLAIGTYVLMGSIYTVSEVEQAIITQFGEPVGAPVTTAGLKFKVPFILFKFLKGMVPDSDVVPAPRSGDNR